MITLDSVSKSYAKGQPAVNNVSLHIEKGEFVFIVGNSGSGKSTLIKLLLKELEPTSGTIKVNGQILNKMKRWRVPKYRRGVGVVFQDFRLLKDRNVYDVMNDVNVDIETMDMSDEEKDACVKRLRHKVKARKTGRNHGWKTAAAAVAAVLILSGGGLTYAAENGSLAWFFDSLSRETGSVIPSKYVDESYINNEYKGSVKVITESDAKVSFDLKKVAVDGDQVNIAMVITYDDFDTEKYESFDAQMQIIEGGANIVSEYAGSTAPGDGISLTNKQTMSDIVYKLKKKNAYKVGDVITMRCNSITLFNKNKSSDGAVTYVADEVDGPWTLQFKVQDDMQGHSVDISGIDGIEKCTINTKGITIDIAENAAVDDDSLENIILEMTDNKELKDVVYGIGKTGDGDSIQRMELNFTKPIDVSQVKNVWIDGRKCKVK